MPSEDLIVISGRAYSVVGEGRAVPRDVATHIKFLEDLNSKFATRIASLTETMSKWREYETSRVQHRLEVEVITRDEIAERQG